MVVEPPSIIVLQIVLSFFWRSILATQTNLSLIFKKWFLHGGVWFATNCHKTQPTNDFQEEIMILCIYLVDSLLILYEYLFKIFFFSLYFGPLTWNSSSVLNVWMLIMLAIRSHKLGHTLYHLSFLLFKFFL